MSSDTPAIETRRPAMSHPDLGYDYDENGDKTGIYAGWDLSFGCRVSFSQAEPGDLYASVHLSDEAARRHFESRAVTREQIAAFARFLLQMVDELPEFDVVEEESGA